MRNSKTLFILGAGASYEAGLPLGKDLIDIIASRLDFRLKNGTLDYNCGDPDIIDILQSYTRTREGIDAYIKAANRIRDGVIFSNSIDSFIDVHKNDDKVQLCGKLGIVKTILEAEKKSKLYIAEPGGEFADLEGLKKTWFFDFAKNLNDGVRKEEISRIFEKVSFIIFNYDRCFEHFMYHALQRHFGVDEANAASIMKALKIIHPYGTIGELPWQDSKNGIPFGFTANRANLEFMASRIKTYTEQITSSQNFTQRRTFLATTSSNWTFSRL